MSEYIIRPLFNCTCIQINRRENLALAGLHQHVAVILKTRKARFGLTSSCLCRNIPDVSRFCREAETSQRSSSPLMGTLGGGDSLRFLCASAMQLVSFCVQKLICVLGNNAGSEDRTYRHDLTRHILRQSLRVALCEKQG